MKQLLTTVFSFFLLLLSTTSVAQTAKLSVQGVLRNANGSSVENGQYEITFRLWDAVTGGTEVWFETIVDVDVEGGIYSVVLGDGAKELNAKFNIPYFLGVTVEGGTELIPRAALTSSPYALSLIGSDNIFPNSGNVGVGSDDPQSKLTIQKGNGIIGIEPDSISGFTTQIQMDANRLNFENPSDKDFTFNGGNLGIGTSNPTNKLHVKSNGQTMFLEGSDHTYMAFGRNGTTRSGYLGYGGNNTTLTLNNEVGLTQIVGSQISLDPAGSGKVILDSDADVNGHFSVRNPTHARSRLFGTTSAYFEFYPHDNTTRKAYLGFTSTSNNLSITNESEGNVYLKAVGGDIYIDPVSSAKTIYLDGFVRARGSKNISMNDYLYLYAHLTNSNARYHPGHHAATNDAYSIEADQGIKAPRFHQKSDRRIKKDFRRSDGKKDLEILNTIAVTDYRHIDEVRDGNAYRKGLIAQQVESVFAEAIEKGKECIPNVMSFPKSLSVVAGTAQFDLAKTHDFKIGDKIKMLTAIGEEFLTVASIVDEQSFTIDNWTGSDQAEELFVYGKEVDDFRTVDYDRVFTLALSATQELARKVDALEKENATLRESQLKSENRNTRLKADLNDLGGRVKTIEHLLNATGSK